MKAPDKLYIGRRNYGPLIGGWKSQPFKSKEIESIEYIRKEALLEWAKEYKLVIETHGDERDAYLRGEYSALNSLIDKLNSM